jgi:AcrR family transcriptional regulator
MRSDARLRREALLTAGEACFRESGFMVPLEQIADRAGVGRGTFYRNFPDRMALALAIFDREVDALGKTIDLARPFETTLIAFVRRVASGASLFQRIAADITFDGAHRPAFMALRDRLLSYLRPLVDKAHAEGSLRADIDPARLLMAAGMMSAVIKPHMNPPEVDEAIAEALDMLMRGLRPTLS